MYSRIKSMRQALLHSIRALRKQPGFAVPVILVLALGIGANTTMFTVLNSVLIHPAVLRAWQNPQRVLSIWETVNSLSALFADYVPVRPNTFQDWKRDTQSFQTLAAWRSQNMTLTAKSRSEQISAGAATTDLFPLLGITFAAGRNFAPHETQVAVISDEFLHSHFSNSTEAIGASIILNAKPVTIIGTLPPGVAFPDRGPGMDELHPEIWTPLSLRPSQPDNNFSLFVYGRLKGGVALPTAQAEMKVIAARTTRLRQQEEGTGINIVPLVEGVNSSDERRELLILQIAVAFVLLIACANAGNLMLTRSIARTKEMAIRSALGASRFRLLRQTFTESLLLTTCAACLGLLFNAGAIRVLISLAPPDAAAIHHMTQDTWVVLFTIGATFVTAILFTLAPAWHLRRTAAAQVLNSASRGATASHHRLRGALAVTEIAMSLVLLTGAALMIRSFATLLSADLGFRIEHLLVMNLTLPEAQYNTPEKTAAFNVKLLDSVRQTKGITNAMLTTGLPLREVSQSSFEIPGRPKDPKKQPVTNWTRATDGYFETLGMRLLAGRFFTHEEASSSDPTVAVVNKAFASTHFPGEDPLGKLAVFNNEAGVNTTYRIVGLVANEYQMGPDNEAAPELYLPGKHMQSFLLVARTEGDPAVMGNTLRQRVWDIDRNQPVADVKTEQAALDEWLAPRRFNMTVLLGFAGIAILLAAMGLYSVLAYTVTLRTREIGVRLAVGATPARVTRHILAGGLKLAIIGVFIGIGASAGLTRFMQDLIYGVDPFDARTFGSVAALVLLVAIAASFIPALRAAKVDPAKALRAE